VGHVLACFGAGVRLRRASGPTRDFQLTQGFLECHLHSATRNRDGQIQPPDFGAMGWAAPLRPIEAAFHNLPIPSYMEVTQDDAT
jgi:hypothetical protein